MGLPVFLDAAFASSRSRTQVAFFRNGLASFSSRFFFIWSWSCARAWPAAARNAIAIAAERSGFMRAS